jgi:ribosomal protein S27AE
LSLPLFLQGLGSIGIFASRAFLPAFATSLLIRFGPQVPILANSGLLPRVSGVPSWFTSDLALTVLGILSVLELVAERFPEARGVLAEIHGYLKSGMAALTFLGVINATDRAVVNPMIQHAGFLEPFSALAVGVGTYFASLTRSTILSPLADNDEDDDLGLQGLIGWVEDLWGFLGPVALIVFPIATVIAFGIGVACVIAVEMRLEAVGDSSKRACPNCGLSIHVCALSCPACRAEIPDPRDIGFLGIPKKTEANLATLPHRLISVKRCPRCASRLRHRAVRQTCGECGFALMDDPESVAAYTSAIDRRVPLTCAACFGLGMIPILGLIPGVILYRLMIIAPYRRYIPSTRGFIIRWGVRLTIVLLVAFQWIPGAGGFALLGMALINYAAYRGYYNRLALSK